MVLGLQLLGGFKLESPDGPMSLSNGSRRLLSFVALRGQPVSRQEVGGTLWPKASDQAAGRSLRSALWRLAGTGSRVIAASRVDLRIAEGVSVDLWAARAIAHRLLDHGSTFRETDGSRAVISLLSKDVLPEWYDDWALDAAEAWRQLRLHTLEALAAHFVSRARFGQAAVAATLAVQADPLRESARIALIGVHLAEGNRSEAVREFHRYRDLLQAELGVDPTPRLTALTADLLPA